MDTALKIYRLLFQPNGRVHRRGYWCAAAVVTVVFLLLQPLVEAAFGRWFAIGFYLLLYWTAFCLMAQRCHDIGRSAWWLLLVPIPFIGIIWAILVLGFRRGDPGTNQYGPDPRPAPPPYAVVEAVQ